MDMGMVYILGKAVWQPLLKIYKLWLHSIISGSIAYKTKNTNLHKYGMYTGFYGSIIFIALPPKKIILKKLHHILGMYRQITDYVSEYKNASEVIQLYKD